MIFVAKDCDNSKIIGLITVKIESDVGRIGLLSVNKRFQGQGIGQCLVRKCEKWLFEKKISKIIVKTQLKNKKALDFYKRISFKVYEKEYIYHYWV